MLRISARCARVNFGRRPPWHPCARAALNGLGALLHHLPLVFRERAEHLHHHPPGGHGRNRGAEPKQSLPTPANRPAGNGFGHDWPQDMRDFEPFRQVEPSCLQSRQPRTQIEPDELGERHREMREAMRVDRDALERRQCLGKPVFIEKSQRLIGTFPVGRCPREAVGTPRGRSPRPVRAAPPFPASRRAGQCRRGSSTRSDMTNAPAATPDRREPLPAHPHAVGAAVATKFGRAGNQDDRLFARRRRESWKVEHAQGLAWADLYLPLPVRGTDFVALS